MKNENSDKDITKQGDLGINSLEQKYKAKLKRIEDNYAKKLKKESKLNAIRLLKKTLKTSRDKKFIIGLCTLSIGVVICFFALYSISPYILYGHANNRGPLHFYATFADGTQPEIEISFPSQNYININIASHEPPLRSDKLILVTDRKIKHRIPENYNFTEKEIVLAETVIGEWGWPTCYIYEIDWEYGSVINLLFFEGIISYSYEHYVFAMDLVNPSIWSGIEETFDPEIKFSDSVKLQLRLPKYFRIMNSTHMHESFKIVQEDHGSEVLSEVLESTHFYEYSLNCGDFHFYAEFISDYNQKTKTRGFLFNGALLGVGLSIAIGGLINIITNFINR